MLPATCDKWRATPSDVRRYDGHMGRRLIKLFISSKHFGNNEVAGGIEKLKAAGSFHGDSTSRKMFLTGVHGKPEEELQGLWLFYTQVLLPFQILIQKRRDDELNQRYSLGTHQSLSWIKILARDLVSGKCCYRDGKGDKIVLPCYNEWNNGYQYITYYSGA